MILPRMFPSAVLALSIASSAHAAIVLEGTYDTVLDSEYVTYADNSSERIEQYGVSSAPTLSADFSTLGDTLFTYTWNAPAGKAFELYTPSGLGWEDYTDYFLSAEMVFGFMTGGSTTLFTPDSITVGMSGTPLAAPSDTAIFGIEGANPTIQVNVIFDGLVVGERYRFENISLTFTVPADYDATFTDEPLVILSSRLVGNIYSEGEIRPDFGPVLTTVTVPEPTAGALVGFALLAGCCVRRRR